DERVALFETADAQPLLIRRAATEALVVRRVSLLNAFRHLVISSIVDRRSLVVGRWSLVDGKSYLTTNDQRPTTNDRRPTTDRRTAGPRGRTARTGARGARASRRGAAWPLRVGGGARGGATGWPARSRCR